MALQKWSLKMANFPRLFFFLFIAIFLVHEVLAITNHTVGDQRGWTTGVDYSSWTAGKTFVVGDFLVFKYKKGLHNVLDVNVSTFSQCATPTHQRPMDTGNDFVPLTLPGFKWFISTVGHDCKSGLKLVISVESPPPPPNVPHVAHPLSSLPSALVPTLPPPIPPASSPSVQSPGQNQTTPQLPIVPTPSENIPPSHSPVPSATAPPPSGAAAKSAISGYLGFLPVAIGVLAGIMI